MASLQILDLPFEEDLSYDELMSIDGGTVSTFVNNILDYTERLIQQGLYTAEEATEVALDAAYAYLFDVGAACQGSDDVDLCLAAYGVI